MKLRYLQYLVKLYYFLNYRQTVTANISQQQEPADGGDASESLAAIDRYAERDQPISAAVTKADIFNEQTSR